MAILIGFVNLKSIELRLNIDGESAFTSIGVARILSGVNFSFPKKLTTFF